MRKLLLFAFIISGCFRSFAQGDLLVVPTRILFEGNKQKETLTLVNTGKDTATYYISWIHYRMTEEGNLVIIEKPDSSQLSSESYLRIFPRKVTLVPREPQLIMLQFRRKTNMTAGEYRSHLLFRASANKPLPGTQGAETDKLNVHLLARYGISIPVIIRTGAVNLSTTLTDINLERVSFSGPELKFTINRTGNISVYGDIFAEFIPAKGKSFVVATIKGVAVYTDISSRRMSVNLNIPPGKSLSDGKLKVKYVSSGDSRPVTFAEADLVLK